MWRTEPRFWLLQSIWRDNGNADFGGASLPMKAYPCSSHTPLLHCFYFSCPAGMRHKQTNRNLVCVSQRWDFLLLAMLLPSILSNYSKCRSKTPSEKKHMGQVIMLQAPGNPTREVPKSGCWPWPFLECLCAQLCPSLCNPMDCNPPGSSVHGIFQARILEQVAVSYSRGSSQPRDQTRVSCISCICMLILYHCTTWEARQ